MTMDFWFPILFPTVLGMGLLAAGLYEMGVFERRQ